MESYGLLSCLLMLLTCGWVHCRSTQLSIEVGAGKSECFYMTAKIGEYIDVEYQVLDGGQGDIDINFHLFSPTGKEIISDYKQSDSAHRKAVEEVGDYRLCWSNDFSRFNNKLVYFEAAVERDDDDDDDDESWDDAGIEFNTEIENYDMKLQDIQAAVGRVRKQLFRSRHVQDQLRAFEARDRSLAETNFELVTNWSLIQIIVMLAVGVIQVVMVRSLFDDRSAFSKVWKAKVLS